MEGNGGGPMPREGQRGLNQRKIREIVFKSHLETFW